MVGLLLGGATKWRETSDRLEITPIPASSTPQDRLPLG
jgi:hypothetical protein